MQYTKKPITIEAIQFKGTWDSLAEITGKFPELEQDGMFLEEDKITVPWFGIKTLEGTMKCIPNDYVIKGIKGEFYPCKPDIFEASYDENNGLISAEAEVAPNKNLAFGQAIRLLKDGERVCREGWNGKGMYLIMFKGQDDIAKKLGYGYGEMVGEFYFVDVIGIKSAQNTMVLGWHPSTPDMLSEDWQIFE